MRYTKQTLLVFLICLTSTTSVFAQTPESLIPSSGAIDVGGITCNFLTGELTFICIPAYIGYVIEFVLGFVAFFFILRMIIAGYKFMIGSITSGGSESGKKEIISSIAGLVTIIFSYLIVNTIISILTYSGNG